jgi:hypothetical protein
MGHRKPLVARRYADLDGQPSLAITGDASRYTAVAS